MIDARIPVPAEKIEAFCRKWKVVEMALFGSVLREDFRPDSDVDVLVTFEPEAPWDLWDLIDMREELRELFGREVDLVEKKNLINPFRRHAILSTKQVIYAAQQS
jgi:predicted nucleotidyltransferase